MVGIPVWSDFHRVTLLIYYSDKVKRLFQIGNYFLDYVASCLRIRSVWENQPYPNNLDPYTKRMCHCLRNSDTLLVCKFQLHISSGAAEILRRRFQNSGLKLDPCGTPTLFRNNFAIK